MSARPDSVTNGRVAEAQTLSNLDMKSAGSDPRRRHRHFFFRMKKNFLHRKLQPACTRRKYFQAI